MLKMMKASAIILFICLFPLNIQAEIMEQNDCVIYEKALMSAIYPHLDEAVTKHYGTLKPYTLLKMNVEQKEKEAFYEVIVQLRIKGVRVVHVDQITLEILSNRIDMREYKTVSSTE